jgi:alcohol dehydrogenase (cytochrome c)
MKCRKPFRPKSFILFGVMKPERKSQTIPFMLKLRPIFAAVAVGALAAPLLLPTASGQQNGRDITPPPRPMPAILKNYQPVTAERLLKPEDGNWLMVRRTYDGWGYSPLDQITPANVARLRPLWGSTTGEGRAHEGAPVINNGVVFITTPYNQVIAFDGTTGTILWRYRRPRPQGAAVPHEVNRGVALYGDKVYFCGGEGVLVALNAKTGTEVWSAVFADNESGYYSTLAPLVAGGKVMVGASGGEYGVRGFVAAFDSETGKEVWRTYTIPAPGEPGSETWPAGGNQWKTGGGSIWITGNYDPETNLAYWGTGNGGPWIGDNRPGDNLYVASTIALDVATGQIKGHFQYDPNESWDWDEVSPPILVDYQRGGRTIKGLIDVARDGYMWFLQRSAGPIKFIDGEPYVYNNVIRGLDPETGRPDYDPAHKPRTNFPVEHCPSGHGGKNWPPVAYSPKTRMIYIPANTNECSTKGGAPNIVYTPGKLFVGTITSPPTFVPGADHFGEVQAWNVDTGKKVWSHNYTRSPNWGGILVTGGGLVFNGGTADRKLHAFDAATGKLVWEFPLSAGIEAPPTSFSVNGKQYIAVLVGWGQDAGGELVNFARAFPGEVPPMPDGGSVWVFALD